MTRDYSRHTSQAATLLDCYDELTAVKHLFGGASFIVDATIPSPETESISSIITVGMEKLDEVMKILDSIRKDERAKPIR